MEADVNIRVVSTLRKGIKEKVNLEEVAAGKESLHSAAAVVPAPPREGSIFLV